jgi:hypothetical protein
MRNFINMITEANLNSELDAWFAGSKITDQSGEPLLVYHGTAEDFDDYQVGPDYRHGHGKQMSAIYFTPLRSTAAAYARTAVNAKDASKFEDGIVRAAYLKIMNPMEFHDVEDFAHADRVELIAAGHDGAVRINQFGSIVEIAAFDPAQIRHA